jgi:hypothetical protein
LQWYDAKELNPSGSIVFLRTYEINEYKQQYGKGHHDRGHYLEITARNIQHADHGHESETEKQGMIESRKPIVS